MPVSRDTVAARVPGMSSKKNGHFKRCSGAGRTRSFAHDELPVRAKNDRSLARSLARRKVPLRAGPKGSGLGPELGFACACAYRSVCLTARPSVFPSVCLSVCATVWGFSSKFALLEPRERRPACRTSRFFAVRLGHAPNRRVAGLYRARAIIKLLPYYSRLAH